MTSKKRIIFAIAGVILALLSCFATCSVYANAANNTESFFDFFNNYKSKFLATDISFDNNQNFTNIDKRSSRLNSVLGLLISSKLINVNDKYSNYINNTYSVEESSVNGTVSPAGSNIIKFEDSNAEYETNVTYIDANGNEQLCPCARVITKDDDVLSADPHSNGFYVVNKNVERKWEGQQGVRCDGAVSLIIKKNCKYWVEANDDDTEAAGINVTGKNSFTLYSQTKDNTRSVENGMLEVRGQHRTSGDSGAALGGNGGQEGCNITINGCYVLAHKNRSGDCACIGGGENGDGHNITINGGYIEDAIHDSLAGNAGSFIGGGQDGQGYNITIRNCTLQFDDGLHGAVVGGGDDADGHDITIDGVTFAFEDEEYASQAALIGGGDQGDGYNISVANSTINIINRADDFGSAAIIGGGDDGDGYNIKIYSGNYTMTCNSKGYCDAACIGGGETATGHDIYIYGGNFALQAGYNAAAIGGGQDREGYNIYIYGGTIDASGGLEAAAIGGGSKSSGKNINISGGTINASGGGGEQGGGAGIGGGSESDGEDITISGGKITAKGGQDAAGIGGGMRGSGKVNINGGDVKAYGARFASGIGGGNLDEKSTVTIDYPAKVYACKGDDAQNTGMAIGCGRRGKYSPDVFISNRCEVKKGDNETLDVVNINEELENVTSKLGSAKCVKVDPYLAIVNIKQDDIAYRRTESEVRFEADLYNLDQDKLQEFLDTFSLSLGGHIEHKNLKVYLSGKKLYFVMCTPLGIKSGDNPFTISFKHNGQLFETSANLYVSRHTITNDMVEPISDRTVESGAVNPMPTVKDGWYKLRYGRDYTLRYVHNKGIGVGKVYIDGIGDYSGTAEVDFNIVPKGINERVRVSYCTNSQENFAEAIPYNSKYYSISDKWYYVYGDINVDHPITISGDVNIILCDGANLNFNCGDNHPFALADPNSKITIYHQHQGTGMINSQSSSNQLNPAGFRTVQRTIYCSQALSTNIDVSKINSVKILPTSSDGAFIIDDLTYTQNCLNFSINLDKNKSLLTSDLNSFDIVMDMIGTSPTTLSGNIDIQKTDISSCKISSIDNVTYTGSEIFPHPIISIGDTILKNNVDYILSWENNINVGTGIVHIVGINDFIGSVDVKFEILPALCNIKQLQNVCFYVNTSADFTAKSTFIPASITDIKFHWVRENIEFKPTNLMIGAESVSYSIPLDKNVSVGNNQYIITINYGDAVYTTTSSLVVKQKEITADMITPINDCKFNNTYQEPKIKIMCNDYQLQQGQDFNVTYSNNFYPGYASAFVVGTNSFSGYADLKFKITPNQERETRQKITYYENNSSRSANAFKIYETTSLLSEGYNPNEEIWYYVDKDIVINNPLKVCGNVHVILCDGATLKITSEDNDPFTFVDNSKLAFHYQQNHTGKLDVGNHKLPANVTFVQ